MSIKNLVRKKLLDWLSDGENGETASGNYFKQGRAGDLTVESSLCGRLAVYSGMDQTTHACLLTGVVGSDATKLRRMLETFYPDLKTMRVSSSDGIGEIFESATQSANGDVVTYKHLFEAADKYFGPHVRLESRNKWLSAFASLREYFTDAATGSRAALVVWSSGRFLVEPKVGDRAVITKEFDVWVKRMDAMANSGGGVVNTPAWVKLAKFGGVCGVLFAGLFAYGSYLQAYKVEKTSASSVAAASPAGRPVGPATATPFSEEEMVRKVYGNKLGGSLPTFDTQTNAVIDDNKIAEIAPVKADGLKKIFAANGLAKRKTGDLVYSFSNPSCSACQHLEGEFDKLDSGANPVVIPVAFDENSMRIGTAIMCSPDPVAAWKTVMTGGTISTAICAEGLKKMEANALLFAELGFNATPTIVATDGRAMVGSVAAPALRKWMKAEK